MNNLYYISHINCEKNKITEDKNMFTMDIIAMIISIIGGLNWGLIGLFGFDLVAAVCGGAASGFARVIYTIVGLAAIWLITTVARYCSHRQER